MNRPKSASVATVSTCAALLLALSACGSDNADSGNAAAAAAGSESEAAATEASTAAMDDAGGGAVSVDNCGREIALDAPPERVFVLYPTMTELLIELGVQDSIIGQANTAIAPPAEDLAEQVAAVPVLSDRVPSKEALLAADPDLIVADARFWFDGERVQTLEGLEELGIPVYIAEAFCLGDVTTGQVGDVLHDLDDLGELFGVPEQAADLQAETSERLDALEASVAEVEPVPTVLMQTSEGQVYGLARGMFSSVLESGGGVNLLEDDLPEGEYFGQISVEVINEKAPEAILFTYDTEENRLAALAEIERALASTPAVQNGRVYGTTEAEFSGTLRSVTGAENVAELLHGQP